MNTEEMTTKKKSSNKWRQWRQYVFIFFVIVISVFGILSFPDLSPEERTVSVEFSAVDKICELATLKCYYHNVLEYEKPSNGLFRYGYKKFWMEYDGIVKIGVDVGEAIIHKPDKSGIVRIYVPKVKILEVDVEEESMSDLISDTGILTAITSDDQAQAYSSAQENMRKCAESDKSVLNAAYRNAKEVLKQYVINVGKQIGQDYSVEWVDTDKQKQSKKE